MYCVTYGSALWLVTCHLHQHGSAAVRLHSDETRVTSLVRDAHFLQQERDVAGHQLIWIQAGAVGESLILVDQLILALPITVYDALRVRELPEHTQVRQVKLWGPWERAVEDGVHPKQSHHRGFWDVDIQSCRRDTHREKESWGIICSLISDNRAWWIMKTYCTFQNSELPPVTKNSLYWNWAAKNKRSRFVWLGNMQ